MKAITLHTAAIDNAGTRRDAGETLAIGEADDEIAIEAAKALVDAASAVESKVVPKKAKTLPDAASDEAE